MAKNLSGKGENYLWGLSSQQTIAPQLYAALTQKNQCLEELLPLHASNSKAIQADS